MADRLASFLDVECDRLDSHPNAFRDNTHRKQLRLKLAEAQSFLRNHESFRSYHNYSDLEDIVYQVDELFDDWEQSEKSKSKIEQEERRIRGLLVRYLDSLPKLVPAIPPVDSLEIKRSRFILLDSLFS